MEPWLSHQCGPGCREPQTIRTSNCSVHLPNIHRLSLYDTLFSMGLDCVPANTPQQQCLLNPKQWLSMWEFPKIGDPNIVPQIVGSLNSGSLCGYIAPKTTVRPCGKAEGSDWGSSSSFRATGIKLKPLKHYKPRSLESPVQVL